MRIPVNLASDPFRRDRPLFIAAVAGCAILALSLIVMISMIFSARGKAAETRAAVDRLNRQLQTLTTEQSKLDATLRLPENAEVLERSILLNTLITRKSISWTRIFADLEKVMPSNVRLINVRLPQINSNNQVTLDMVVAAESPEPVIEFLRKLEKSPLFGTNNLVTFQPPSDNAPLWRYRVNVSYAQKL